MDQAVLRLGNIKYSISSVYNAVRYRDIKWNKKVTLFIKVTLLGIDTCYNGKSALLLLPGLIAGRSIP